MDDGVVWVLGKEHAMALGRRVTKDLKDYGFLLAEDRSACGAQRWLLCGGDEVETTFACPDFFKKQDLFREAGVRLLCFLSSSLSRV